MPAPVGPKIDPALITLMPPDTILAAGARVEELVKTPMFQKYFANLPLPVVDQFAEQTGMDPRKSLWEVLLVSDGIHRVVLGRGRFGDQMEAKLERSGAVRMEYKGTTLVGNDHLAVIFLNDTTAAVGDVASLHALIDGRSKSNGPPPAIAERLKDIPPNAQLWTVYTGPVNPASIGALVGGLPGAWQGNLANLNRLAAALQSVSVYFDLRTGLSGQLHGVYTNDADARTVRDALKGFDRLRAPVRTHRASRFAPCLRRNRDHAGCPRCADQGGRTAGSGRQIPPKVDDPLASSHRVQLSGPADLNPK